MPRPVILRLVEKRSLRKRPCTLRFRFIADRLSGATPRHHPYRVAIELEIRNGRRLHADDPARFIRLHRFPQFHEQAAKHVHADEGAFVDRLCAPEIIPPGFLDDRTVAGVHKQRAERFPVLSQLDPYTYCISRCNFFGGKQLRVL